MKAHARLGGLCAAVMAALWLGGQARAATIEIKITDEAGVGFNDPTPVTPVGGNTGTTLGEQRRIVFQFAADAWGRILESPVPIVVEARFANLTCSGGAALAGHAGALSVTNYPGLPTGVKYPLALANRIMGRDLYPDKPDIQAEFNSGLMACMGLDWYYGLDGKESSKDSNLLSVVMHELAHGLGFADGVDPETGAFSGAGAAPSTFAEHVLDNTISKHWTEMTDDERKASLIHARSLVWDGERVHAVAARLLAKGSPTVQVSPQLSDFSGILGEASYGRLLADGASITGSLITVTLSACSVTDSTFAGASGKIVLLFAPKNCSALGLASQAEKKGAIAVLVTYSVAGSPPPSALEASADMKSKYPISIPTLALTFDDANLLKSAPAATSITLSADSGRLVGADGKGNTMMYASNPIKSGSTGAHWDPLVRPDLTLEPVESVIPHNNLEMERALLWDMGWTATCGNGTLDENEECDEGAANSDSIPDACRLDCKKHRCGDGTVDTGEACDPGAIGISKKTDTQCKADCTKNGSTGTGGTSGSGGSSGGNGGNGGTTGKGGQSGGGGTSSKGGSSASGGTTGKGESSGSGGATGKGESSGSSGGTTGKGESSSGDSSSSGGTSGSDDTSASSQPSKNSKSSGCSCRITREPSSSGIALLALGLAFVLRRSRRRR